MMDPPDTGRRPRLLVLASTYPRWPGDPEPAFVHELARRLAAAFDVTVVCPHAPGAQVDETMDGVRVWRYRYAPVRWETLVNDGGIVGNLRCRRWKWLLLPGFLVAQALATRRAIRRLRPNVIHAHWLVPQGLMPALMGVFDSDMPPVVVTSHGADLYALRSAPLRWLKRFVASRAAAITVVSSPMRTEILRLGVAAEKVCVQSMGVDLRERFHVDPDVVRESAQILFVGRLVAKKGLRHLVDAMPRVLAVRPDARLDIVGFGPEEPALRSQVQALGLGTSVQFRGAMSQAELPALYRRAGVFAAPFVSGPDGDQEGLGLVLVEAAGCGCPVVAGDVAAIHDVVDGPAVGAVVNPADPQALADALLAAMSGTAGSPHQARVRAAAVSRFDWEQRASAYAGVLEAHSRRD